MLAGGIALNPPKFKIPLLNNNKKSTDKPNTDISGPVANVVRPLPLDVNNNIDREPVAVKKDTNLIRSKKTVDKKKKDTTSLKISTRTKSLMINGASPISSIGTAALTKKSEVLNSEQKQLTYNQNRSKIIPTLAELNEKRIEFNISIGFKYSYFSPLHLIDDYVKKMSRVAGLDFNLLTRYLPKDNHLSVASLSKENMFELCKLISRSSGKVNYYVLMGFDSMLRQNVKRPIERMTPKQVESLDEEFVLNNATKLGLSEGFIFLERYSRCLQSLYSTVEKAQDGI